MSNSNGPEIKDAARVCTALVKLEERAALLYQALARRFDNNKELSWFWFEMSMEERQHAQLLEFCGCEYLVSEGLPERKAIQSLSKLLTHLEARASRKNLSVDDAFLIAAELEASEINDVYAGIVKPIQGTWYIMRKKIETLITDHMQTLIRAARKFGVSAPALAELAEIKRRGTRKRVK
jgi:hypothetical protein